jgi:hypothetical protein
MLKLNMAKKKPESNPEMKQIVREAILESERLAEQEILDQSQPATAPEESAQPLDTSSPATSEPDHFDELIGRAEEVEQEGEKAAISAKMLTQDQFRQSFIGLHGMASSFTGWQSLALPNSHVNEATANEVADTLYETILDVPMLHFMIQPGNKWLGRTIVMAVYVQGMRQAITAEAAQKRKEKGEEISYAKAKAASKQKTHDSGELTPEQQAALTGA